MPWIRRCSIALAGLVAATGCGHSGGSTTSDTSAGHLSKDAVVAKVASYDLIAGKPTRFLVGLVSADASKAVSYGTVHLQFSYLGQKNALLPKPQPGPQADAPFLAVPGQKPVEPTPTAPEFITGSGTVGVYGADQILFPQAGFWQVQVRAKVAGKSAAPQEAFEVADHSPIPNVGDKAPAVDNPVVGAPGVDPKTIDSRADATTPVPDAILHKTSVAAALAAHRPFMVVVSTPVFCQSRFCGPVTDSVENLAKQYGDRTDFIHLEVWQDFQKGVVNPYVNPWIDPGHTGDGNEPWVWTVGGDGIIKARFDNVVTDQQLEQAVKQLLS